VIYLGSLNNGTGGALTIGTGKPLAEEAAMKELIKSVMLVLIGTAAVAHAGEIQTEGGGLLVTLFLGFWAVILVFQLVPGLILLGSMIKGLFSLNSPVSADDPGRKS
jgi:hypothetical protein